MSKIISKPNYKRLPGWLKAPLPKNKNFFELKSLVQKYNLNTVCESASCPNIGECWDAGTLTFSFAHPAHSDLSINLRGDCEELESGTLRRSVLDLSENELTEVVDPR